MKKYSFLPILALVLGIAASAFTVKPPVSHQSDNSLWHFIGTNSGQQSMPEYYELADEQNTDDCSGFNLYCVIEAPEDQVTPGQPDLSNFNPSTDVKSRKP